MKAYTVIVSRIKSKDISKANLIITSQNVVQDPGELETRYWEMQIVFTGIDASWDKKKRWPLCRQILPFFGGVPIYTSLYTRKKR